MTHTEFWELVDSARAWSKSGAELTRVFSDALLDKSSDEILYVYAWMSAYRSALAREDLWAAAYTVRGGCSDDSFDYFRSWLISLGEAAVLAVVHEPEALIELVGDGYRGECTNELFGAAPSGAYETVTGELLPWEDAPDVRIPGAADWPPDRIPAGLEWSDEFLAKTYPVLHAKFA